MFRLGIDTGGTNTDVVLADVDSGRVYHTKTPTTPKALLDGIMKGIDKIVGISGIDRSQIDELVYGTTIVVNMIAQKQKEAAALITTKGFRDALEIGRAYRSENIYDIQMEKNEPLVRRDLRFEASGRMDFTGRETEPVNEDEIKDIVKVLRKRQLKAVAVCLMNSYANPAHEIRIKEILEKEWPEGYVSISSEINPQFREYERTSTTVINAYMTPNMVSHIDEFKAGMKEKGIGAGLYMMQSNAGVMTFDTAEKKPVSVADSGPIAGIIASNYLAGLLGEKNVITFDIGGTSTDVSLIKDNTVRFTTEGSVEGYPISLPSVDLSFIGAGGGSIAWVDRGGALKVGPVSAGADPGPVCYGRGGEKPTVTDANLICGRIRPEIFEENLDGAVEKSRAAVKKYIADPLGIGVTEAAEGILDVVNSNMLRAVKLVSVQKGFDPRDFALVAYGGAGALHAGKLAEELEMEKVYVPYSPGTFSAQGLVLSDIKADSVKTKLLTREQANAALLNEIYAALDEEGTKNLEEQHVPEGNRVLVRTCDMRYFGQAFEISVPVPSGELTEETIDGLADAFHELHRRTYGHCMKEDPIEFVNYRVSAIGTFKKPDFVSSAQSAKKAKPEKQLYGKVIFDGKETVAPIYDRDTLDPGERIEGPAIIGEMGATAVVYPGHTAEVDRMNNLILYTNVRSREVK
ncbi:MAG: hydantoinase/oxoprolinase family protein [Clostridia bacterium]|nr:hydantoinase/oxoprolinase family protein [Clostridia bacterium]